MGVSVYLEDGLLILDCQGDFEFSEANQTLVAELKQIPATSGPQKLLISDPDSTFRPSAAEAPFLAQSLKDLIPAINPHVALVVALDVKFGIGRMISIHCEDIGVDFQVFRDMDKAKEWLRRW